MEARNREERAEISPLVAEHFVERLKHGGVGDLVRALLADPVTHRRFQEIHQDRAINMGEASKRTTIERVSSVVVSLMRDPEYRKVLIDTIHGDFQEESDLRHQGIRAAVSEYESGERSEKIEAALVYDEVVIGAGVHAAIYNIRRTMDNPQVKSLTVESGNVVSANFRTKEFVRINTANRPQGKEDAVTQAKMGNPNSFGKRAPIQVPYIESERFPAASTIADVATANQFLSNSDMLFDANPRVVFPWEDPNSSEWPARYKVVVGGGEYVFANRVELATGFGDATLPESFDEESLSVVQEAMAENGETESVGPPPVMTYETFARYVTDSDQPFRHFVGKTIDMGGGGDSAATTIEFLLRWAKKSAYKNDVVQVGEVRRINWIGQKTSTRDEFYKGLSKDRYSQIAGEMPLESGKQVEGTPEKKIHPMAAHLVQIRKSDKPELGRFRTIYQGRDEKTGEPKFQEGYTDVIILATGYKSRVGEVLGMKENPFDDSEKAQVLKATFEDIDARLPVAVKLKGEEVYAMGPGAISDVFAEAEFSGSAIQGAKKKGKKDLSIAISTFGPRTEKLSEVQSAQPVDRVLPRTDFAPERVPLMERTGDSAKPVTLQRQHPETISPHMSELRTKLAVAEVFERFQAPEGMDHVTAVFEFVSADLVTVRFEPSLAVENCKELCDGFSRYRLPDLVLSQLSANRFPRLDVTIPFTPKGGVDVPGISINKPAVRRARAA